MLLSQLNRSLPSSSVTTIAAVSVATVAAVWLFYRGARRRRRRSPPGPPGWPLLGNLPNLPRPTFLAAHADWRKRYGDLVSYRLGARRFVVLNSYAAVKEALVSQEFGDVFSGRMNSNYINSLTHGKGIVSSEGELWREHRRFALKVLRDFGFARAGTEDSIHQELQDLRDQFNTAGEAGVDTTEVLCRAIANVISMMLFGYRAGSQDDRFEAFLAATQENLQGGDLARFIPVGFPLLYQIPGVMRLLELLGVDVYVVQRNLKVTHGFCQMQIDAHRAQLAGVSSPNDFLDAFLMEQEKLNGRKKDHTFDDFQLKRTLTELFVAGTDTTSNTIRWALLYACLYPECQARVQAEIDAQIGRDRLPEHRDRKRMPYTLAFIDEVQRFATLAPFAVLHRCPRDVEFMGYDISSDDLIMTNLYGIHHDPELWSSPEAFQPERFLAVDTGEYQPNEHLVPFGVGKRACLGESLARQELFLFIAGILQQHSARLHPDSVKNLEDIKIGSDGIVHAPGAHRIIFSARQPQRIADDSC
ncbi:hypothetical protein BOX15_Mlig013417g1 [Macrostomum lignano]|uniref:Cytochrome P450 n=2 Tax=Macrostomum lignano TaxID=282301 RepID=A0A1I8I1X1_9PLAT|nr:hypothetical protein BOX15_Mlig013417g1 [Macrostomum lignano]